MELLEWDAATYESLPLPHKRWGTELVERLELEGDETVVDLGCGTGRDVERLLSRLPRGRVIAIDGSQQMLDELLRRECAVDARLRVIHADLREPLDLGEQTDAVISVATLHWLPDHADAFENVARNLRPGGRFLAECGGEGNLASFQQALVEAGGQVDSFWHFPGITETLERLARAGFSAEVKLVPDPAVLEPGEQLEAFIATVLLGAHLRELPLAERRPLVAAVAAALSEPAIDFVRLQIDAVLDCRCS